MDSLITIIVFLLISAAVTWFNKRQAKKGETDEGWPEVEQPPEVRPHRQTSSPPPPRPQPRQSNWEEELRRLLEGEPNAPPPPPPPRPVVIVEQPRPAPRSAPPPIIVAQAPQRQRSVQESSQPPLTPLISLAESAQAYEKASRLAESVATHLQRVTTHEVAIAKALHRATRSPDAEEVVRMFKNPRTARQAVIASLILSPPKSLEQSSGAF